MTNETITKFKGPGQWRSQAARLEEEVKPVTSAVVAACYEKACAPPPAGAGGSSPKA